MLRSTAAAALLFMVASGSVAHSADQPVTSPPIVKKRVAPEWPKNARLAGLSGDFVLECQLGTDGIVRDWKRLSGPVVLAEAAGNAVKNWRYEPARVAGKPLTAVVTVTVRFGGGRAPSRDDLAHAYRDPDPEIRRAAVGWLGRILKWTPFSGPGA